MLAVLIAGAFYARNTWPPNGNEPDPTEPAVATVVPSETPTPRVVTPTSPLDTVAPAVTPASAAAATAGPSSSLTQGTETPVPATGATSAPAVTPASAAAAAQAAAVRGPTSTPTGTAPGVPPVAAGDDHGNFAVNATMVALFTVIPGSIETETDKDYFSFTAGKGIEYTIEVDQRDFRAILSLFDRDGINELTATPFGSRNWTAPESGTYYIQIDSDSGRTGTYTVTVIGNTSLSHPTPLVQPGDDHGDFAVNATKLPLYTAMSGSLLSESDRDYFSFTAGKGIEYTIEVDQRDFRAILSLFDRDGINELTATPFGSRNWTAPESGTYYIQIDSDSGRTGTYTVTVIAQVAVP